MVGTPTKVHIVLDRAIARDPEKRRQAFEIIVSRSRIHSINQDRLDRFGIITGIVDLSMVGILRRMAGVRSVSVDEERHAL